MATITRWTLLISTTKLLLVVMVRFKLQLGHTCHLTTFPLHSSSIQRSPMQLKKLCSIFQTLLKAGLTHQIALILRVQVFTMWWWDLKVRSIMEISLLVYPSQLTQSSRTILNQFLPRSFLTVSLLRIGMPIDVMMTTLVSWSSILATLIEWTEHLNQSTSKIMTWQRLCQTVTLPILR